VTPGGPPRRPRRRVLVAAGIALVATLLLIEGALRLLLFVDVPGLERVSARLRKPQSFFTLDETGYWTTQVRFLPPGKQRPVPGPDSRVGWTGFLVEPGTYAHRDAIELGGRRPVLLYGDSFAGCTTGVDDCWQGLMERSELDDTHQLLNYGVGGYGFDQTVLLMEASVERFLDRDPIVILSVLVDDDLDRALLRFRGWPKPRFGIAGGELVEPEPVAVDFEQALDDSSPFVGSWAWRWLTHAGWGRPTVRESPEERARVEELARLLLDRAQARLDALGVEWFVLLFQGTSLLAPARRAEVWQHDFLVEELRARGMPFVTVRREIGAFAAEGGVRPQALYELEGRAKNHYTVLGNQVVFPAFLRGIRGEFD
jgi:hypothetical protein